MYVKKEGAIFWFCSQKCMRNMFKLRRLPLSTRWTDSYHVEKSARGKTKEKTNVKAKPAKGKKGKK
jgi:large subunit ribosomal protein L24e